MAEPQVWGDGVTGTGIGLDVWNVRTVVATDWSGGRLLAFAIEDGQLSVWGDGYLNPEGISIAGDEALVAEQGGTLLRQDLLTPGRANAVAVATGLGALHAVVRSDDATTALLTDLSGGRVVAVDLATGAATTVVGGLNRPLGLAVGPAGEFYVTEQGSGTLTRYEVGGAATPIVSGLTSPFLLSWTSPERTALLVTERSPAHRVSLVDLTAATPAMQRLVGRGIKQPSQAAVVGSRLVVTGAGRLISLDATAGLRPGVTMNVPAAPMWPGSWADVVVDTGVTGWTRADLDLVVEPAGLLTVSAHPAADADPTRPSIRLLAGALTGPTQLVARDSATNEELGRADVAVDFGPDPLVDGPPLWLDGPTEAPRLQTLGLPTGVADAGTMRPLDSAGNPLTAWRVATVLVDTNDAKWPTTVSAGNPAPTVADARTTWRDALVGANGVDAFYREMSGGRFGMAQVSGGVLGPVSIGGTWTDWFLKNKQGQWYVKDEVVDRVVGALQKTPGVDWSAVDAVFLVFRSAGGNFIWPRADLKRFKLKVKNPAGKDVDVVLAKLGMPHDQLTAPNLGFTNVEVTAHEIGHTLGLDDLYMDTTYTAEMQARALGVRELMGNQSDLPHLAARHKLLLGFLDPGHVRSFVVGLEDDATFDLAPLAAGLPPAGRVSAVELKVTPKLSWFFEFRQPVAGKIGDTVAFGAGGQVMGYDATSYKSPPVVADKRRPIILLLDDGDGEGALLTSTQDLEKLDASNVEAIQMFRLEVLSITAGVAKVRVKLGKVSQPDPVLQNNRGQAGDYKSPDIEIRNEMSDKDGAWLNKPLLGLPNRVVAKVRNAGGLDAPDVVVRFTVPSVQHRRSGVGAVDRARPSGEARHPAGKTVEFQTGWTPDVNEHHCIQARIDRYVRVPRAAADEPDVDNNLAQSNYFEIYSKPASPASREVSYRPGAQPVRPRGRRGGGTVAGHEQLPLLRRPPVAAPRAGRDPVGARRGGVQGRQHVGRGREAMARRSHVGAVVAAGSRVPGNDRLRCDAGRADRGGDPDARGRAGSWRAPGAGGVDRGRTAAGDRHRGYAGGVRGGRSPRRGRRAGGGQRVCPSVARASGRHGRPALLRHAGIRAQRRDGDRPRGGVRVPTSERGDRRAGPLGSCQRTHDRILTAPPHRQGREQGTPPDPGRRRRTAASGNPGSPRGRRRAPRSPPIGTPGSRPSAERSPARERRSPGLLRPWPPADRPVPVAGCPATRHGLGRRAR